MDKFTVLKKKRRVVLFALRHGETHTVVSEYENFLSSLTIGFTKPKKAAKFMKRKVEKLIKKGFKVVIERTLPQV